LTGAWHQALRYFQADSNNELISASLTEIMNRNGSDKGSGHHNYTEYYQKIFEPLREEKLNVLEIGIGTTDPNIPSSMCGTPGGYTPGSSLRGWAEYFHNSAIYGCDIDTKILFQTDRIHTFGLDQTDLNSLNSKIVSHNRVYDIIIDDGLHNFVVNWNVLKTCFCKLASKGYYIIEDICDFNPALLNDPFMEKIEFRYISIPNAKNKSDNNIVVARWKGEPIFSL
jgi:ribosomal protein L11 methylase PrmA